MCRRDGYRWRYSGRNPWGLVDPCDKSYPGLHYHTYYFGSHPSNIVPMQAKLPNHKREMIEAVKEMREQLRRHLDEHPVRGGDGSILNR